MDKNVDLNNRLITNYKNKQPISLGSALIQSIPISKASVVKSNTEISYNNGLTNGNGLTDGNGLTNGNGLTLSNSTSNIDRRSSKVRLIRKKSRKNKMLSITLAIILIILPILLYSIELPGQNSNNDINIDNEFNDWPRSELISDRYGDQQNNPNIDIIHYQIRRTNSGLAFFVEIHGNIFNGISKDQLHYPDNFCIFIDSDSNSKTGYSIQEVGADYLIKTQGLKNKVTSQRLLEYNSDIVNDNRDWLGWEYLSRPNIGVDNSRLEGEILLTSLAYDNADIKCLIFSQDYNGNFDMSDTIFCNNKNLLEINSESSPAEEINAGVQNNLFMTIEFQPLRIIEDEILVSNLVLEKLGNADDRVIQSIKIVTVDTINKGKERKNTQEERIETLEDSSKKRTETIGPYADNLVYGPHPFLEFSKSLGNLNFNAGLCTISFDPPLAINKVDKVRMDLLVDINSDVKAGSCLGFKIIDVGVGVENTIVNINQISQELSYLGGIPDNIVIDGAFGDWSRIMKFKDTDLTNKFNPDLNIQQYSIANSGNKLNLYFQVTGNILAAANLPISLSPIEIMPDPHSNFGTNVINEIESEVLKQIPKEVIAKDRLHVFFDTDVNISTGFNSNWLPLGADYMVQITGSQGKIVNQGIYSYASESTNNGIWSWGFESSIDSAKDLTQLETSIDLDLLEFDMNNGLEMFYVLSNWDNSVYDNSEKLNLEFKDNIEYGAQNGAEYKTLSINRDSLSTTRAGNDDVVINEVMFNPPGGPYDIEWDYRKKITINSSLVSENLTDFPLLINITDTDLRDRASNDGNDILFLASDMEHRLEFEVESYNNATGKLVSWVRIPEVSSTNDTEIYMYYGNPNATSEANSEQVWDENYTCVWHLKEDPSGSSPQINDSTSYNNDGTTGGSMTSNDQVHGKLNGGMDFDGVNDNATMPTNGFNPSAGTVETWVNFDSLPSSDSEYVFSHCQLSPITDRVYIRVWDTAAWGTGMGDTYDLVRGSTLKTNIWYHLAITWDGSYVRGYLNGTLDFGPTIYSGLTTTRDIYIMAWDPTMEWADGTIDEMRVSNITRSAEWISTQFNNTNSSNLFHLFGPEESTNRNGWYNSGGESDWLFRKSITINSSQVEEDLTDFPVLIKIIDSQIQDKARSDGYDLLFTSSDGITKLDHEVEEYNSSTGELIVWVKIPTLLNNSDTELFIYYGNQDSTEQQNPIGVWDSNYTGIWHLKESPSGAVGEIKDSTSHFNNGTTVGSMSSANSVDAKIGLGLEFDEIDDMIRIKNSTSLNSTNATATIQLWIWWDNASDGDHQIVMSSSNRFTSGANDGYEWASQGTGNHFYYPWGGDVNDYNLGSNPFVNQTWHYLVVTQNYSSKKVNIYVDGNAMSFSTENVPTLWTQLAAPDDWLWGGNPDRATRYFDGMYDEIRVSNIDRSLGWIQTEFNNQNSTNTFYTFGSEESLARYEWVELYNADTTTVDLTGWILSDNDGNYFNLSGVGTLPIGAYLICHLGQSGTNSSTNIFGPIINNNSTQNAMLEKTDDLTLENSTGTIVDFIAWGGDAGIDDDNAVSIGEWTDTTYINTSELLENQTIGRDKDSTDTDTPSDWENSTTNNADPFGVNATSETRGAQNIDIIIPEFKTFALPLISVIILYVFTRKIKYSSKRGKLRKKGNVNETFEKKFE